MDDYPVSVQLNISIKINCYNSFLLLFPQRFEISPLDAYVTDDARNFQPEFKQFLTLTTAIERINYCVKLVEERNLQPAIKSNTRTKVKNNEHAFLCRKRSLQCIESKNFREAILTCNSSICHASTVDMLNEGYVLRSEIFKMLGMHELSLKTLDLVSQPVWGHLMERIITNRAICNRVLREAKGKPKPKKSATHFPYHLKLSGKPHSAIPFVDERLSLKYHHKTGRTIVPNVSLGAGKILAIEKGIFQSLAITSRYSRCAYCFQENCFDLIPCNSCTETMFCNNGTCQGHANHRFHGLECPIISFLQANPVYQIIIRIIIDTFRDQNDIDDYQKFLGCYDKGLLNAFTIGRMKPMHNHEAKLVYTMNSYEHQRDDANLFYFCRLTAFLDTLLREHLRPISLLFDDPANQRFLRTFLFKHLMVVATNKKRQKDWSTVRFHAEQLDEQNHIANGLYPFLSLVKHSCKPNVILVGNEVNRLVMYSTRVIQAGADLYIDYV